jgi:cytochrome P450
MTTVDLYYEPWDPACRIGQWDRYQQLLEDAPVYRAPSGTWVVSRYDDIIELMRKPDVLSSRPQQEEVFSFPPKTDALSEEDIGELFMAMSSLPLDLGELAVAEVIVGADDPKHARLRKIVNRGFTRRRLLELTDKMDVVAAEAVAAFGPGAVDIVTGLATPLPVRMISDMLSLDPARGADVARWSELVATLPQLPDRGSIGSIKSLMAMLQEFSECFVPMVDARRAQPLDDLISDLVRATDEDALTSTEAVLFLLVLMVGGNETSANLIGSAVAMLMQHPDQLELVRKDDSLIVGAVEETLRFQSPLQFGFRRTLADVEVAGQNIPEGELVCLLWGAANRDPRRFEDPDRFDVTRTQSNIAFGHGAHLCLGAHLARMEGAAAIRALLPVIQDYQLDSASLELLPSPLSHGFREVVLQPR